MYNHTGLWTCLQLEGQHRREGLSALGSTLWVIFIFYSQAANKFYWCGVCWLCSNWDTFRPVGHCLLSWCWGVLIVSLMRRRCNENICVAFATKWDRIHPLKTRLHPVDNFFFCIVSLVNLYTFWVRLCINLRFIGLWKGVREEMKIMGDGEWSRSPVFFRLYSYSA